MADGFLGRWSQRKQAVREGKVAPEPEPLAPVSVLQPAPVNSPPLSESTHEPASQAVAPVPLPTLDDVHALTADSSFAPFVARDVAPEVRNAAMKKLFTDPHYNVMDRLDIYIDDYSLPSPLSASMLADMASAQFLKLVDPPDQAPQASGASAPQTPAATAPEPLAQDPNTTHHDHTDLRLQPNDAPQAQQPGRRAE